MSFNSAALTPPSGLDSYSLFGWAVSWRPFQGVRKQKLLLAQSVSRSLFFGCFTLDETDKNDFYWMLNKKDCQACCISSQRQYFYSTHALFIAPQQTWGKGGGGMSDPYRESETGKREQKHVHLCLMLTGLKVCMVFADSWRPNLQLLWRLSLTANSSWGTTVWHFLFPNNLFFMSSWSVIKHVYVSLWILTATKRHLQVLNWFHGDLKYTLHVFSGWCQHQ